MSSLLERPSSARAGRARPQRYLLWLGAGAPPDQVLGLRAVSLAANRWQGFLLQALSQVGEEVETLGYLPEPAWPRGAARGPRVRGRAPGASGAELVSYLNLPVLRHASVGLALARSLSALFQRRGLPQAIFTYNASPAYAGLALRVQRRHRVPWIAVLADYPNQARVRAAFDWAVARARGQIFLSAGWHRSSRHARKLHLDGGIPARMTGVPGDDPRSFLFAGTVNHRTGADTLIRAFKGMHRRDVRLWICGRSRPRELARLVDGDERIEVFGVLPEAELARLHQRAFAFVNPRPAQLEESGYNFPSKLLGYLSYGKPIISCWTEGLAPEYREVLEVTDGSGAAGLRASMERVLTWDRARLRQLEGRITSFRERGRTWTAQAARLVEWLDTEVA